MKWGEKPTGTSGGRPINRQEAWLGLNSVKFRPTQHVFIWPDTIQTAARMLFEVSGRSLTLTMLPGQTGLEGKEK